MVMTAEIDEDDRTERGWIGGKGSYEESTDDEDRGEKDGEEGAESGEE